MVSEEKRTQPGTHNANTQGQYVPSFTGQLSITVTVPLLTVCALTPYQLHYAAFQFYPLVTDMFKNTPSHCSLLGIRLAAGALSSEVS